MLQLHNDSIITKLFGAFKWFFLQCGFRKLKWVAELMPVFRIILPLTSMSSLVLFHSASATLVVAVALQHSPTPISMSVPGHWSCWIGGAALNLIRSIASSSPTIAPMLAARRDECQSIAFSH